MDSAQRNDAKETAATYLTAAALREAAGGNPNQARNDALAALRHLRRISLQKSQCVPISVEGFARDVVLVCLFVNLLGLLQPIQVRCEVDIGNPRVRR